MSETLLHVRVSEKGGGYTIEVWDGPVGKPNDFAKIDAHDLTTGLQMAVPYMRACVEPNPLAELISKAGP